MAPKSPPTAYMDTISDQSIVTVCWGGAASYLSYQLLLMKCFMYCGKKKNNRKALHFTFLSQTYPAPGKMSWLLRQNRNDVSHRWGRTQSSDVVAGLKASTDPQNNDEEQTTTLGLQSREQI